MFIKDLSLVPPPTYSIEDKQLTGPARVSEETYKRNRWHVGRAMVALPVAESGSNCNIIFTPRDFLRSTFSASIFTVVCIAGTHKGNSARYISIFQKCAFVLLRILI